MDEQPSSLSTLKPARRAVDGVVGLGALSRTFPDPPEGRPAPAGLGALIRRHINQAGGWLPFDRFMALALYAPGLGYYSRGSRQFGLMPESGSDFVTAPELSPLFGQALAQQVRQALDASQADEIFEFGAGSGALAQQLLQALGERVRRYSIIEVSGPLREHQAARLAPFAERVRWLEAWPEAMQGVVLGNEVLDAMPVQLLAWDGAAWHERGVVAQPAGFAWADRPTQLRPPLATASTSTTPGAADSSLVDEPDGSPHFAPGTVTEIHPQAQAFVRSLAAHLVRGAAFFIDYGFPEAEYYHPQRVGGTLMCHRAHRSDSQPLHDVGAKDITAHVDFTGIALAAQDAGLDVIGYTSQAHFLLNCGLLNGLENTDVRGRAHAQKLLNEHEMGELFKVIGLAKGLVGFRPLGFAVGDRTHTL